MQPQIARQRVCLLSGIIYKCHTFQGKIFMTLLLSCFHPQSPLVTHNGDYSTWSGQGHQTCRRLCWRCSCCVWVYGGRFVRVSRHSVDSETGSYTSQGHMHSTWTVSATLCPLNRRGRRGDQGVARAKVCAYLHLLPFCFVALDQPSLALVGPGGP